jgi:hypothetical protein
MESTLTNHADSITDIFMYQLDEVKLNKKSSHARPMTITFDPVIGSNSNFSSDFKYLVLQWYQHYCTSQFFNFFLDFSGFF